MRERAREIGRQLNKLWLGERAVVIAVRLILVFFKSLWKIVFLFVIAQTVYCRGAAS